MFNTFIYFEMSTKNPKSDNDAGSDIKQKIVFGFIQYYISMVSNEDFDRIKHYKSLLTYPQ